MSKKIIYTFNVIVWCLLASFTDVSGYEQNGYYEEIPETNYGPGYSESIESGNSNQDVYKTYFRDP